MRDRYGAPVTVNGITKYPQGANDASILVKVKEMEPLEWTPRTRRVGVIARKIGNVPLWQKDGKKIWTTMLQVEDNHVIKYIPPGEYQPTQTPKHRRIDRFGCLMVGACGTDPSMFTKGYCGLFANSGVAPKKYLGRFIVTPDAALPAGHYSFLLTLCRPKWLGLIANVYSFVSRYSIECYAFSCGRLCRCARQNVSSIYVR